MGSMLVSTPLGVLTALTLAIQIPTAAAAATVADARLGGSLKCPNDLHSNLHIKVGVTHCMCPAASSCVGLHCATGHLQQYALDTVEGQKIPRDAHGFNPAHCPDCRCVGVAVPAAFVFKESSSGDLTAFPSEPNVAEVHYTARPGKRAKIAVATVIVRGAAQIGAESAHQYAEMAFPNHREYCRMHGYGEHHAPSTKGIIIIIPPSHPEPA